MTNDRAEEGTSGGPAGDAGAEVDADAGTGTRLPGRPSVADWEALLGGAAEARWLLSDPEVLRAIDGGSGRALHVLFRKRLSRAPTAPARETLLRVLGERRLFVDRLGKPPGLARINGIGTTCQGAAERRQDGTYITTRFFTLVFLPVLPLGEYLVAKAKRGWYFLGRVPSSPSHRRWRHLALGAAGLCVAFLAYALWNRGTHDDVHFLNGLDFSVTVTMGGQTVRLDPGDRRTRTFASGSYHVVARRDARGVLEELDVRVPGDEDLLAYNVLGAAPLVVSRVAYSSGAVSDAEARAASGNECMAGTSWCHVKDVDDLFVDPPKSARVPRGKHITTRTHVTCLPGGWRTAVSLLEENGSAKAGARLAERVALLTPSNEDAVEFACQSAAAANDTKAYRTFLDALMAAAPESISAHRYFQSLEESLGKRAEILPRYEAAYEADPTSARAGYLYARIAPFPEALRVLEPLVQANPNDPWLRRSMSWVLTREGRFADAVPHYEKLLQLDGSDLAALYGLSYVEAATGRADEALRSVDHRLRVLETRRRLGEGTVEPAEALFLLQLYASVQRLVPRDQRTLPTVGDHTQTLFGEQPVPPAFVAVVAARARDDARVQGIESVLDDPGVLQVCQLALLSRSDVEGAARSAASLDPRALGALDDVARLSIACELFREGRKDKAQAFLPEGGMAGPAVTVAMLEALPDLGGVPEDLDPEWHAVLFFAASRRTDEPAREHDLLEKARRWDAFQRIVPPD